MYGTPNYSYFPYPLQQSYLPPQHTWSQNNLRHSQPLSDPQYRQILRDSRHTANMAQMSQAELEEFQNLSDRYHADLPGELIGEKLPMDVLVTEYAQADSTFVVKTTGLAATHSSYRAVKGDGQCGWRATVFSYFEILLKSGDPSFVQTEMLRFQSYADSMKMIGLDYELLEDMFASTFELFEQILQALNRGDQNIQTVLNFLNNQSVSDSIVYHFKMVTSTHMELRADQYEPFLEMTVQEYRAQRIDPTFQEIDQIGLQALTDAVISAAEINLEVLYLDRSAGEEVTPHAFSSVPNTPHIIRLLYRPGHYDIIYKEAQQPIQVYLAPTGIEQRMEEPQSPSSQHTGDIGLMESLYGQMSFGVPHQQSGHYDMGYHSNTPYMRQSQYENFDHFAMPQSQNYYAAPPRPQQQPPPAPMYQTNLQHLPVPPTAMPTSLPPPPPPPSAQQQSHHHAPRLGVSTSTSSRSVTISPSPTPTPVVHIPSEPQIRFTTSMHNMHKHISVPLTQGSSSCSTNVNHFQHQNFNPHHYDPNEKDA